MLKPPRINLHFALWSRIGDMPRWLVARWQLWELKKTILGAYTHTTFYRELCDRMHIKPNQILTLNDLGRLPITSKQLLRDQPQENVINWFFPSRFVRWTKTSGSTGEPFRIPRTPLTLCFDDPRYYLVEWHKPLLRREMTFANLKNKLRVAQIRTFTEKKISPRYFYRPTSSIREDPEEVITALRAFRPDVIEASPMVMVELARAAERLSAGPLPTPSYINAYGESFNSAQRKIIEDAFGSEVYDYYGLKEVGFIGIDCDEHNGVHINEESYIVEILDEHNVAVAPGEEGRIVVTYFYNYVMPFIRYDTGDRGILLTQSCPCGLNSPRLRVDGKRGSFIVIGKKNIHSTEFATILHKNSHAIVRYQIAKTGADRLALRIIPTKHFTPEVATNIKSKFMTKFSFNPEIQLVDTLPLTARGKSVVYVDETNYN